MKITGLEALRGLCAVIVAIYHGLAWSGKLLPTWGLYAVYIFFSISGAVLYLTYAQRMSSGAVTMRTFLVRRFARLAPLYAAVVVAAAILNHQWPGLNHVLNVAMLFGFANPGATSTVVGGWSLGIEMVMYVLFPVLLVMSRTVTLALVTLVALLALRFATVSIALRDSSLVDGWVAYTQPGTFLCFFFAGMLIAKWSPGPRWWPIGILGVLLILALPGESPEAVLIGWQGFAYTVVGMSVVLGFFWSAGGFASRILGEVSYGLYLLHPLVWALVSRFVPAPVGVQIAITVVSASLLAWLALHIYEIPAKKWILQRTG